MNRFTDSGRPSRPWRVRQHAASIAVGLLFVAIGAVLRFVVTVGSPRVLHVHDVGVVLMLAGAVGMLLPGSSGGGLRSGWLRTRWISPAESQDYGEALAGADPGVNPDATVGQDDDR